MDSKANPPTTFRIRVRMVFFFSVADALSGFLYWKRMRERSWLWLRGAMVAHLTPDQEVASSILVRAHFTALYVWNTVLTVTSGRGQEHMFFVFFSSESFLKCLGGSSIFEAFWKLKSIKWYPSAVELRNCGKQWNECNYWPTLQCLNRPKKWIKQNRKTL